MDHRDWERIQELFHAIADLSPQERVRFLDEHCGDDPEIRAQVEKLIVGDAGTSGGMTDVVRDVARDAGSGEAAVGRRIGPYRVERVLGSGGMGDVFLATRDDEAFVKQVAIKVLRAGLRQTEWLKRFQVERQMLASLEHPHIARLLDGGTSAEGEPYVVMEYVDGVPIDRYSADRQLTHDARLELMRDVCSAVAYAHRNLIVHRDLKPGNILVTADGTVKLLDFGIAKLVGDPADVGVGTTPVTGTELRLMTREYASPEQIRGEPISTATDVYSLGVLLYELLTGRRPYRLETKSTADLERAVLTQEPERPRITGDLDNIVLKALRKESERRYVSVEQLADDLKRYASGMPVLARPSTRGYRLRKFIGRHRFGLAAAALVAIGVASLVGFYTWRLQQERDEALRAQTEAEQVSDFLVDLFRSSDPDEARGEEVTARELLARGAERVEEQLAGQPRVLGTMLDHIGSIYRELGNYEEAEITLTRALEIRRDALGAEHPDTLRSRSDLIYLWDTLDRSAEALPAALENLEATRRVRGPEHADTLEAMGDLAGIYKSLGRYDEARELYEQALEGSVRTLGEEDETTLWAMNSLALAYRKLDRLEDAERTYRRALELWRKVTGEDSSGTLAVRMNMANLLRWNGDNDAASEQLEMALEHLPRVMGEDHPQTLAARHGLGMVYLNARRNEEAEALYRSLVDSFTRTVGETHRNTLAALSNLGMSQRVQGNLDAAEATYDETIRRGLAAAGPDHPQTLDNRSNLAAVYTEQGRYAEAESIYADVRDRARRTIGPDQWLTLETSYQVAALAALRGDVDRALEELGPVVEAGFVPRGRLEHDPSWNSLREDPRFIELLPENEEGGDA